MDATCVQFGSRGERIPPSRGGGENSPRYMGHIDDCIVGIAATKCISWAL